MTADDIPLLTNRIAFAALRGITPSLARQILTRIGSEERFFATSERQLASIMGFSSKIFADDYRRQLLAEAENEAAFVASKNVTPLYFSEPDYPSRLLECSDAPLMLFGAGKCDLNNCLTIGIVGTRHATPYGTDFTVSLVKDLAERVEGKLAVISGLAFGIDIAAHRAALRCGVPTVAVLAHGLNTIYPAAHRQAASEIARGGGLLLTDYRTSSPITKHNFLARNRIVAGLCDCLVVAESAEKGGAMITARLASEYNRDVFALPGRIGDRYSAGCNLLIRRNIAALTGGADDIIAAMQWPEKSTEATQGSLFPELSDDEQRILDYLQEHGEAQINPLSIALSINVGRLTGLLIELEFKHLVTPFPGGKYRPSRL